MKISLITLHCVDNYGSVLQTYATQKSLELMGHEVEVIDYIRPDLKTIKKLFSHYIYVEHNIKGFLKSIVFFPSLLNLHFNFRVFRDKYFKISKHRYYTPDDFSRYPIEADAYAVGSDQVWNTILNKGILSEYFLGFAPQKNSIKFAFSSSFGVDKLTEAEKVPIKRMLSTFDFITTRELSGVDIIHDLGIEHVRQILDPTLLLSGKEWNDICEPIKFSKPYLLVYQLHHQEGLNDYLKGLAQSHDLEVIRICYRYDEFRKYGHCIYAPSVGKLLSYIKNAAYVVTDSFHVTAFSVNMNVQFESLVPDKQFGGRINSLLRITKLEARGVHDFNHPQIDNNIDYTSVNEILNNHRLENLSFIKKKLENL